MWAEGNKRGERGFGGKLYAGNLTMSRLAFEHEDELTQALRDSAIFFVKVNNLH